jgi:hypothetical protein
MLKLLSIFIENGIRGYSRLKKLELIDLLLFPAAAHMAFI